MINEFKGTFKENISLTFDEAIANGISIIKIKDIPQAKSSWLLKSLLMNNGVRPINNTLDRLAYVTLLTNIPTAIYDAMKVGTSLNVARASEKDTITGFDDKVYKLSPHDVVIKSSDHIIGLGGILGDKEFGLSGSTKDIVVEVANFNYVNIRNTATRLDIKTDAARRFAKAVPNYLIKLALHLIYEQFSGYQVSFPIVNLKDQEQIKINVDFNYINRILGVKLQPDIIKANLKHLGYTFENDTCLVPLHRLDIKTTQDISEEVAKFLNVNELPLEPVIGAIDTTHSNIEYQLINKLKGILTANYFNEVKTYNLTSEENLKPFNVFKYSKFVKIENAHNVERSYLRTNLINELLNIYQYNNSYKTKLVPVFEIQKVYAGNTAEANLTMLTTSTIDLDRISGSRINMNVNVLKGIANNIANLFNATFEYFMTSDSSVFYSNELLAIQCNGKLIGYVGSVKSSCLKSFDLQNQTIYCLTLNLDMLLKLYVKPVTKFTSINNLMPIYKDVSFIIHPLKKITNLLEALTKLDFIDSYEFIDRYVINEEQISYTIRFRFNNTKGLDTKTIDNYLQEIEKQMVENHATIRK
jgi:phenylalanyl-tRNA synthetase beta chain